MSTQAQAPSGGRILDGYRVVDCSEGIAGPVATLLLAEAGADVVKVERPGGDPARSSLGFLTWNRSKRSVVLDLDTSEGRGDLDDLLRGADVLVHGFGPARAAELRLTDDGLRRRHPHLVTSSVLAWPVGHPSADGPIDDLLVSARLGLCDEQLGHREGPVFLRFPFGSWCAVYLAAVGILARLVHRGRGGPAGPANTSVAQGALVPTMMHWARADHPGEMFAFGLPKDLQPSLFECGDGVWIHLMRNADVDSPLMAQALADLGPEGVAKANAAFTATSTPGYPNHGANQVAFRTRPSQEWLDDFWSHDIPAQPAAPYGAILADPQVRANDYVVEVDDPVRGRIVQAATPFSTEPPSRVSAPAPALGQHTDEVLSELRAPAPRIPTPPAASAPPSSRTPLGGLRVLDLGNFLAGPLGPMLLADLGAEVVKVEATTGDQMRRVERVFAACQRGKKGLALDLKSPAAREALEALVRWADVVHHNLRMPAARRLGLDYEALRAIKPDIVYCHTSSYGPRGDRADWPGYDQLFQAAAGWEVLGGGEGNDPMWFRFGFMDHLCAMGSVVATLLAVLERDRTGRGQSVTGSLLGGAVLTNSETFLGPGGLAASVPPVNHEQTGLSPGYRLYRMADGWIALCARDEDELARACAVAGVEDPLSLEEALADRRCDDALSALDAAGVPCEPVRLDQGETFLDDPLNRSLGLVASYDNADWGELEQVGAFWDLGNLELALDRAPPALGEHSVEVLREVGLEPAAIDRILAERAALQYDPSRPAGGVAGAGQPDRFDLARQQHAQRGAGSSEGPDSTSTESPR